MPGGSVKIGRLAGIPIGINPLWLLIVALITWSLGDAYYPEQVEGIAPAAAYLLGLASALLLFASILLHELGHAIVARRHGVAIEGIDLWLLGGVAKLRGTPHSGADELRYAVAGPAVTALIIAAFGAVSLLLPADSPDAAEALIAYQVLVNAVILGFNLIPAFPLDGGRVLRAVLWARSGDMAGATATAAAVGRWFAYFFVGLGAVAALGGAPGGLWLVLIGFFLVLAGRAEEAALELREVFSGHEAGELASFPAVTVEAGLPAARVARDYFARYRYQSFPVVGDSGVLGLVTIKRLESVPAHQLEQTPIESLIDADPALVVDEHTDVAELLERPAFQRAGRAVVTSERHELGILSVTEVERALRASRLTTRPE